MKKVTLLIAMLMPLILCAQTISINTNVINFFKNGANYNCPYENKLYKFSIKLKDTIDYKYAFTLQYNTKSYTDTLIKDIDNVRVIGLVASSLLDSIDSKPCNGDCTSAISSTLYRQIIDDIVRLNISDRLEQDNVQETNIGEIIYRVNENTVQCYEKKNRKNRSQENQPQNIKVDNVSIVFEDGIIKDMILTGEIDNLPIQFKNYKSFSVRNPVNINQLNDSSYYLFSNYKGKELRIPLHSVMFYKRNPIGSGTYIPKNDTISINKKVNIVKLYKDNLANCFEIKIFSDVSALQKNNPNGMLQLDCRLNLILSTTGKEWFLPNRITSENSLLIFNRITPYILFPKIENSEKSLQLSKFINDTLQEKSFNYASSFDLFNRANINLGVCLNLITLLTQSKKIRMDISAGLFQTRIDSTLSIVKSGTAYSATTTYNQKNLINWYIMPEFSILFIESDRIEFETRYGFISSKLVDNEIKQTKTHNQSVNHIDDFSILDPKNWVHKLQCNINVHPNPKKKETSVFMRGTYLWNQADNNLSLQLGYSTSITNLFNQFKINGE